MILHTPPESINQTALMELIEDRHGRRSTIITSQLLVKEWYEVIEEKTLADYPRQIGA